MTPRLTKPTREWTQDDYAAAYGTVICPDGSEWVRMEPKERMSQEDLELEKLPARDPGSV